MSEERDILSLTDDEEDFEDETHIPEKHGTLSKWTNYLHGWQDRYIVLKDGTLSYYKSETETSFGCRGAVSLAKASVIPHQFDECRFDVSVNDSLWYLRASNEEERQLWNDAIELHRQAESGYGSENNLRRHGSMLSLTSGTSLSTASASSFKRGRGLKEKLMEMETFRDILCRQVDTLQSYFDSCASAVSHGVVQELTDDIDADADDDVDIDKPTHHPAEGIHNNFGVFKGKDLASVLQQHGGHAVDFKGEAFTFKATTAGIVATLSHCIDLMSQREEAWKKRLEREVEKRKKIEEAYKSSEKTKPLVVGGPDYEEGPHCMITEDEFYDAVDATLDKLEKEEETKVSSPALQKEPPKISLLPSNPFYEEINRVVSEHQYRLYELTSEGQDTWTCIAEEGEMRVYKRELEVDGVVVDPLKAVTTISGITGYELCHHFWDIDVRMEWEATLESSRPVEWLSEDTLICNNVIKRVWPASQRDALFWSHIRHIQGEHEDSPDSWIVVNYSCDHPTCPTGKYVRITMNVAMICQTIVEPPAEGPITRDNVKCKITYTADVNPGGWAPASVLRAVYKREYPKFIKRFTQYVRTKTADKPVKFQA